VHKWKNCVGVFATVVLLTVSSCATSTPAPTAAPPPPPPPPPPSAAAVQQKIVLRGVHFNFNQYEIRTGDTAVLDEAITILKANPGVVIDVNGYCDDIGDADTNQKLSEYRANAVTNYLLNGGINVLQLRVHGYGKTNFVATNKTEEGRAQNRRVELVPKQ
jgi:outer membrane protein OmpA-like peptidoglycan-associated protein